MRYTAFCYIGILIVLLFNNHTLAQNTKVKKDNSLVYIDKNGVMRWRKDNTEASFFGVNYTTPFAYAYRAHKALNADIEKSIQQDVYHMARLGLDAFRVHVWDTEISDVSGNLLENEHLRLYDFLLAELKKRGIKTIITPIAFWGNGYPERDEDTPGFSRFYGRGKLTTNDSAIVAQENYLKQFFKHVNPYTGLTYENDPDVIAVEINNEPAHNGPKSGVTNYINRLTAAIKSTGWSKPVFYNISQGPYYADAVAASNVNGFSFQWYPSGLVSGNTLRGNYLPNVDKYIIPFDTIPAYAKKALMVYEFDAADILDSYMYPAMARSFREAGFQWATQFAYDPMAIAYANTEYQTHYLNLAYTPSKAISMLIASRVFHRMPRFKNYGGYPANSQFDVFRVSYEESLSEMNTDHEFYYSNSTKTKPVSIATLQRIAGVGSSPVVTYGGCGAYFLDKLEDGAWRLEVMPDAIRIRDPFERPSPKKEVTRIQWNVHPISIDIPELGADFSVTGLNDGNTVSTTAERNSFDVRPGVYLLERRGKKLSEGKKRIDAIGLNEFAAPQSFSNEMILFHQPAEEVSAGKPFTIQAKVVGIDTGSVVVQISRMGSQFKSILMQKTGAYDFAAEVPADMVTPGVLNYRIILKNGNEFAAFPGNLKGDPASWDNYSSETWKTFVAAENGILEIFNPTKDRGARTYPVYRRGFLTNYVTGEKSGQLIISLAAKDLSGVGAMGFQYAFAGKLKGRMSELESFDKLIIRARSGSDSRLNAKVTLMSANGYSASSFIQLTNEFRDIGIPLNSLKPGSAWLMPRPYPGFQPLEFKGSENEFRLADAEKVEITIGHDIADLRKSYNLEVECIWLGKKNDDQ